MSYPKAGNLLRFMAALVDDVIVGVPILVLSLTESLAAIGWVIGFLYILKDGIIYEITKSDGWRGRSIGKKLFGLQVIRYDGGSVNLGCSAKRNLIFFIPLLAPIEALLVIGSERGRRLGDRWAGTQVVESDALGSQVSKGGTAPIVDS